MDEDPLFHGSTMINKSDWSVYFLNLDIRPTMAGIEMSALNRSKIFCDILEMNTTVLTVAFNNSLENHVKYAMDCNRASQNLKVLSLYDYFLESNTAKSKKVFKEDLSEFSVVDVEGVPTDFRVYDQKGRLVGYCRRHDDLTISYINYLKNGKIFRRETYDTRGFVNRTEVMQPKVNDEESLVDSFHRPDGSPAIVKICTLSKNVSAVHSIHLTNKDNRWVETFDNDADLNQYWLEQIARENKKTLFVVDRCNEFFVPAMKAKQKFPDKLKLAAVIHGVHTGGDVFAGETNMWYRSALENLDNLDALVVLTPHQKLDIEARYKNANNKIHVIPHACVAEPQEFEFKKRNLKKIVYVARFSPEKKHTNALEIFSLILKEIPQCELHFYGFGQTEKDIKDKISELGIGESVYLHPYDQDLNKIYSTAGLSILTSDVEGFCMSVLESLSYSCPVVSYNIKYGPEAMIQDGINGVLVKPFDQAEFASQVIKILQNEEYHYKLSNGCNEIFERFGKDAVAEKWIKLIDSLS